MPKRSLDIGRDEPNMAIKPPRKTERSHEENQERAYIAASRRADRSIEARVQSARMASEIHKKRTGKGFRITEEIVTKEEMYEEEEEDFPLSYRLLGPHMQTSSAEMNFKVEAYLSNKVAMSKLLARTNEDWRENEINRLFAQSFPNANRQAQQLSQGATNPPYPDGTSRRQSMQQSPVSPSFQQHVSFQQAPETDSRRQSYSVMSPDSANIDSPSTPALTAGSITNTPRMMDATSFGGSGLQDSSLDFGGSAFTAELPPEAKMLMSGVDLNESYGHNFFGPDWTNLNQLYDPYMSRDLKTELAEQENMDMYTNDLDAHMRWEPSESWDTFINENWGNDQQQ